MAITVVQAASAGATGTGNLTATLAANITAGNAVVAIVTSSFGSVHTYVAGDFSATDAFTVLGQVNDATDTQSLGIAYIPASVGGYKPVTFTCSPFTLGFDGLIIMEVSGLAAVSSDAGNSHDAHTGGSSATNGDTSGAFTTTANGDLLVAGYVDIAGAGATFTAGTTPVTFAIPSNAQITSPGATFVAEAGVQTTAGAGTNPAITASNTDGYIGMGWSFKAATGGITSTASVTLAKPGLALAATETESGAAAVTLAKPVLALVASTASGVTSAGAVTLAQPALSVVATGTEPGAIAVTLARPALALVATETFGGTGAVTLAQPSLALVATESEPAAVAVTLAPLNLALAATVMTPISAAGAVTLAGLAPAFAVTVVTPITVAGAITLASLALGVSATSRGGTVPLPQLVAGAASVSRSLVAAGAPVIPGLVAAVAPAAPQLT